MNPDLSHYTAFIPDSNKRKANFFAEFLVGRERSIPWRIGKAIVDNDPTAVDDMRPDLSEDVDGGLVKVYIQKDNRDGGDPRPVVFGSITLNRLEV